MISIRKTKCGLKEKSKENIQSCSKKSKIFAKTIILQLSIDVLQQVVISDIENHMIIETNQLAKDNPQEFINKFNI
ncbi:13359_t:CDS:2, partial [Cetraspora pellucida]